MADIAPNMPTLAIKRTRLYFFPGTNLRKSRKVKTKETNNNASATMVMILSEVIKTPPCKRQGGVNVSIVMHFYHPDFTVGIGVSPIHALASSRAVPPVDVILVTLKRHHYRSLYSECQRKSTQRLKYQGRVLVFDDFRFFLFLLFAPNVAADS